MPTCEAAPAPASRNAESQNCISFPRLLSAGHRCSPPHRELLPAPEVYTGSPGLGLAQQRRAMRLQTATLRSVRMQIALVLLVLNSWRGASATSWEKPTGKPPSTTSSRLLPICQKTSPHHCLGAQSFGQKASEKHNNLVAVTHTEPGSTGPQQAPLLALPWKTAHT